jgi:hypothetical protein
VVQVIPVVDIAQIVFDFLNHENQTWHTRMLSPNHQRQVPRTLVRLFTRVFDSPEVAEYYAYRKICLHSAKPRYNIFFESSEHTEDARAIGICFCKHPHYASMSGRRLQDWKNWIASFPNTR